MQIGDTGRDITSVLLTTDITPAVVDEAVMLGCDLIVSHHPLLFHGLKQICGQSPQARVVETAIRHNIAIYSAHTSLDSVQGGINTRLADMLGIKNYRILVPSSPSGNPGLSGNASLSAQTGLGIIGSLPKPMTFDAFLSLVRDTLHTTYIRYTLPPQKVNGQSSVTTVALCGGSGAEFISEAISQGADVYLTADCKYHEFQDAEGQIALVDIDHWVSERHAREIFRDIITPLGVPCFISKSDKTPINIY